MQAVVLREFGGPDVLRLEQIPTPQLRPTEVLIQLKAAALNRRDVWIRRGQYADIRLPAVLGSDGAGLVVDVGRDADRSWLGQEVVIDPCLNWGQDPRAQASGFSLLGMPEWGTYAEFVKVPSANVHNKPCSLSFSEAASLPVAALTAYRAVFTRASVQPQEIVLVTGVGGGVASFVMQMAQHLGARVFVTSSSEAKRARALEMGAERAFDHRDPNWGDQIAGQVGCNVDVVIDGAGGDAFAMALKVLKPGGRLVSYGATLGPVRNAEVRRIFWKQLTVLGTTMGTPLEFEAMLKLYENGLRPVID